MSTIKNSGLDQYGAEPFEQQQFGSAEVEGVNKSKINILLTEWINQCKVKQIKIDLYNGLVSRYQSLKLSDMARDNKGSHGFTCHPFTNHTCLYSRSHRASPPFGWYSIVPTQVQGAENGPELSHCYYKESSITSWVKNFDSARCSATTSSSDRTKRRQQQQQPTKGWVDQVDGCILRWIFTHWELKHGHSRPSQYWSV